MDFEDGSDIKYSYVNTDWLGRIIFDPCCGMEIPAMCCLSCPLYEDCYGRIEEDADDEYFSML